MINGILPQKKLELKALIIPKTFDSPCFASYIFSLIGVFLDFCKTLFNIFVVFFVVVVVVVFRAL